MQIYVSCTFYDHGIVSCTPWTYIFYQFYSDNWYVEKPVVPPHSIGDLLPCDDFSIYPIKMVAAVIPQHSILLPWAKWHMLPGHQWETQVIAGLQVLLVQHSVWKLILKEFPQICLSTWSISPYSISLTFHLQVTFIRVLMLITAPIFSSIPFMILYMVLSSIAINFIRMCFIYFTCLPLPVSHFPFLLFKD